MELKEFSMFRKKTFYSVAMALLLLNGCGSNDKKTDSSLSDINYTYKVINNKGELVKSKVGEYEVRLYSDSDERADDKSPHKGVVVRINETNSELMSIQSTYIGKHITAKVYQNSNLVNNPKVIEVTDENPIVKIDVEI
jgi:hypothetical protein